MVTEFDGERVRSVRQFCRLVKETPPGQEVSAIVSRNGQRSTLTVTPRSTSTYSFLSGENRRALEALQDRMYVLPTMAVTEPSGFPLPTRLTMSPIWPPVA